MKSLILVAHGSRRETSNDEVRQVAERLSRHLQAEGGEGFLDISAAFLELAPPSIPDGIVACVDRGADEVVVLPYFLSAGRHVATDIPQEVERARAARPAADIRISPYLGSAGALMDALAELAMES